MSHYKDLKCNSSKRYRYTVHYISKQTVLQHLRLIMYRLYIWREHFSISEYCEYRHSAFRKTNHFPEHFNWIL